jgi:ATP-dependent Lhr-like helicase
MAYVEPTDERGRSRWRSAGQPLHFALCQAMTRVLARDDYPVRCSRRAQDFMQGLRARYDWVAPERSALVRHDDGAVRWWTFAGKLVNAALAHALREQAAAVRPDNLSIGFDGGVDVVELRTVIQRVLSAPVDGVAVPLDEAFVAELKFAVCLPPAAREQVLSARYDLRDDLETLSTYPVSVARLTG